MNVYLSHAAQSIRSSHTFAINTHAHIYTIIKENNNNNSTNTMNGNNRI